MDIDYKALVENISDGLYFVDQDRRIIYWNREAEKITGFPYEEVIGRRCRDNILIHVDKDGKNLCGDHCPIEATVKDGRFRDAQVFLHHKDGHRVPVWIRAAPLRDVDGNVIGGAEFFTDLSGGNAITEKLHELENLSLIDELTQLANRRYVEMDLDRRILEKKRYGFSFGLLLMDIDHFKSVNDTYGHAVGDRVLQTVSRTFLNTARQTDLMGRWGGEEFMALLGGVDKKGLSTAAERVRVLIEGSPLRDKDLSLNVTVSIGATMAGDTDTVDTLFRRVDDLLYESKNTGRNRCTIG